MKPMIKYRGGKSKEIPHIMWHIPRFTGRYIEPFIGGGALYFYLEPREAIINDINKQLINFYKGVRNNFQKLRKELDEIETLYEINRRDYETLKAKTPDERVEDRNEALYYLLRDMFNNKVSKEYSDALLYYFINKTAYSGMIRYNADGDFNVPYGRYKHFGTQQISLSHCELLKRTEIHNVDYSKIFNMCADNDFVFLDPPYDCAFSDYGNVEYKDGFNEDSHRRLAEDFKNFSCKALMVIGKTPLTEELYRQFIVDEYEKSYAVNIRNRFKSEAKHLVIANYKKDWDNVQIFAPETNKEYAILETSQVMLFEPKKKYSGKNR
jgi:DNA adenine methylase